MIVNGEILSPPIIQEKIAGGNATITGKFTDEEVRGYIDALHGRPKAKP
jgi:preprotein translocase subunit SecD